MILTERIGRYPEKATTHRSVVPFLMSLMTEVIMKLTYERLHELLNYDPETGVFIWRIYRNQNAKIGDIAGNINKINGYRMIMVDYHNCKASRLAWFYMEGYWPEYQVDHRDRVRDNDKWENLRHATPQCNVKNCGLSKNNISGITGVNWIKDIKKWQARIYTSGKAVTLGYFKNKIDAAKARWEAEIKYNWTSCNSASTAYLYLKNKGEI